MALHRRDDARARREPPTGVRSRAVHGRGVTTAGESSLPEIGRTRSVAPACAAYRDLVIPSVRAAMKADTRFARSREHLAQYVYHADDAIGWGRVQYMNATNINRDALGMLAESLVISRALGDPRLRKDSPDPQIQAERAALQKLYDVQNGRAWLLYNFSARAMRDDIATREGAGFQPDAAKAGAKPHQPAPAADPHALPTPESGLPELQASRRPISCKSTCGWPKSPRKCGRPKRRSFRRCERFRTAASDGKKRRAVLNRTPPFADAILRFVGEDYIMS